jgi:ABC-type enterochelin transport system permease subunit
MAVLSRHLFDRTLSDPNGIRPAHVKLFGSLRSVDLNLAAVVAALLSIAAIIWIYRQ